MSSHGATDVASETRTKALAGLSSWSRKSGFAVIDQGLFAGANFLVNIMLARWLEPNQYGAFAVAYSVFLFLLACHAGLLIEPMLVYGVGKYSAKFRCYLAVLICGHWAISIGLGLCLALAALFLWQLASRLLAQALLGLAIASPCMLWLWFMRRACYVRVQPQLAATGGGIYLILILVGMYGLYIGESLSGFSVFLLMGIASLVGAVWLLIFLQPQWQLQKAELTVKDVVRDHWRYGRWASVTSALAWTPDIAYALLPVWVGLEGSAGFRAVMNMIMPVGHIFSAVSVLLLPHLVRTLGERGEGELSSQVISLIVVLSIGTGVYCGLIYMLQDQLFTWLYGGQYREYERLLPMVGTALLPLGVVVVVGSALRAQQRIDQVFWCYVFSSLFTLTIGVWLIASWGVSGAVLCYVIATGIIAVSASWFYCMKGKPGIERSVALSL